MKILDLIIKILLIVCLFCSIIMLLPGSILLDINPKIYRTRLPKSLKQFHSIDSIQIDQFVSIDLLDSGAESIAFYEDKLVLGSSDGTIYQLINNTVKRLIKIESDENQIIKNKYSGTLGLKFDSKGSLYVVKPNYGIYRIDKLFNQQHREAPEAKLIFDIDQTIKLGHSSKFFNDIAIEERPDGQVILYVTDVSGKFTLTEFRMIILGSDTSGRLLRYEVETGKLDCLVDNLFYPNGIEISKDQSILLFSEFGTRSLWKYRLNAIDSKPEQIMYNLPAEIDNIRISPVGPETYWLAMLRPRSLYNQSELDYLMRKPLLRKLILRTFHLIGSILELISRLISNDYLEKIAIDFKTVQGNHILGSVLYNDHDDTLIDENRDNGGMLIECDQNGKILNSIYTNQCDRLAAVSEVREIPSDRIDRRTLYLASYSLPIVRKMIISI